MGCPLQLPANEIESWFINLWNHFVIPYLMGAVLAGIEVGTAVWVFLRELFCVMDDVLVDREGIES